MQFQEFLVSDNVTGVLWNRLRRLTSSQLCRKVIQHRAPGLTEEELARKAKGMSWAVDSALGYWDTKSGGLNSKTLSRYYAILQLSIAEQVASPNPNDDLSRIQRHTNSGHGLTTIANPEEAFPFGYYVGLSNGGHFRAYCKHRQIDVKKQLLTKRAKKWSEIKEEDKGKYVSLADLLRRIPELQSVVPEYFETFPLAFGISPAPESQERSPSGAHSDDSVGCAMKSQSPVALCTGGHTVSLQELESLSLPIAQIKEKLDATTQTSYWEGLFQYDEHTHWHEHSHVHVSDSHGANVIVPVWDEISEPFVLHLIILYAFSIFVRYLPDIWHKIEYGELDHMRALLEHYLLVVDSTLPALALERLTGRKISVFHPGAYNAFVPIFSTFGK